MMNILSDSSNRDSLQLAALHITGIRVTVLPLCRQTTFNYDTKTESANKLLLNK